MGVLIVLREIWCATLNEPFSPASFVPLIRIKQACIICKFIIGTETVFAVNPVSKNTLVAIVQNVAS